MSNSEDEVNHCTEPKCRADLSDDGALSIYCDICEGLYCLKCMKLPDITKRFFNMITNCENLKIACDKCFNLALQAYVRTERMMEH